MSDRCTKEGNRRFVRPEQLAREHDVPRQICVFRLRHCQRKSLDGVVGALTMSTSNLTFPFERVPMMACFLSTCKLSDASDQPETRLVRTSQASHERTPHTVQTMPGKIQVLPGCFVPRTAELRPGRRGKHPVEDLLDRVRVDSRMRPNVLASRCASSTLFVPAPPSATRRLFQYTAGSPRRAVNYE